MTKPAKKACRKALGKFKSTCEQIESGEISMATLKLIQDNERRACRLCEAANMILNLQGWLDKLILVEEHIQSVRVFCKYLGERVNTGK